MVLYRPVGLEELRLVYESRLTSFPPRLPEQPIFYPVLTATYAAQIARDWNAKSTRGAGYVTKFEVDDAFARRYEPHQVGAREHTELWVPAEELPEFNRHIRPPIRITEGYFGDGFQGMVPDKFMLAGKSAWLQAIPRNTSRVKCGTQRNRVTSISSKPSIDHATSQRLHRCACVCDRVGSSRSGSGSRSWRVHPAFSAATQ
jgi:hypothetical protein